MLNSLIIAQQQQSQQQQQQQHVAVAAAGTLEQLIRAAKLMEQRAVANNLLLAAGPMAASTSPSQIQIAKLGEDYQERILASKIRATPFTDAIVSAAYVAPNSTGSSRRSSPISAASSAPHSPDTTNSHLLALANPTAGGMLPTTSATHHHQQVQQSTTVNIVRASSSASSSAHSQSGNNGGNGGSRRVSGSRQSRAAHNELEKNRRANLRGHLEALKSVLPPESDSHRDTTLSLLTRARNHIRFIKEQKCGLAERRAALLAEHLRLREMLQNGANLNVKIQPISEEDEQIAVEEEQLPAPKPIFANILATTMTANEENVSAQAHNLEGNEEDEASSSPVTGTKPLDLNFLALNGLLPALPLLYPYNSLQTTILGSAPTSATNSSGEFC